MNSYWALILFEVLLYFHLFSVSVNIEQFSTALTIKGGLEDVSKEEDPNEDLEVFHPTSQWQTLKPGQAVPAGCHVRLNLQTGQREAKLDEENSQKYLPSGMRGGNNKRTQVFMAQELKEALKKIKGEEQVKDSGRAQFRSVDELKRDMAAVNFMVETDVQIISKLLFQLNSSSSTVEQMVTALLNLEYLVHQVDNAHNLVSMGGMVLLTEVLNNTDVRLQESAAFVLGSAVSSNPLVQVAALEHGTLQSLLTLLATPRPLSVKKKVLFALVCLLHHFPSAQSHFLKLGGLHVLRQLFQEDGAKPLRVRIITLLCDMINEELILQKDPVSHHVHKEALEIIPIPILVEEGWCDLVPQLLASSEHDWREKTLQTLVAMMPHCKMQYLRNPTLIYSLHFLQKLYQKLALTEKSMGEEDGYFGEILFMVDSLVAQMH